MGFKKTPTQNLELSLQLQTYLVILYHLFPPKGGMNAMFDLFTNMFPNR